MIIYIQIRHPRGKQQGESLGKHLENPEFGPRQEPRGRKIPPISYKDPTPSPHQLVGGRQICSRILTHEGVHGNMISTKDLWGMDEREILVWHHRMNRCFFKYLIRLSKR